MEKVEDVLLHQKLLASAKDPINRPVFHIRLLEVHLAFFVTQFQSSFPTYWVSLTKKNRKLNGKWHYFCLFLHPHECNISGSWFGIIRMQSELISQKLYACVIFMNKLTGNELANLAFAFLIFYVLPLTH